MGGRGAMMRKPGERVQEYKTVGKIAGIKVLVPLHKKRWDLPIMSNTPGTSYYLLFKGGGFHQYRKYNSRRLPVFDIDYGHSHKGSDLLHIHYWKNGNREKDAHNFNSKDFEKYGKILRDANFSV